jgi:hypothetical protein
MRRLPLVALLLVLLAGCGSGGQTTAAKTTAVAGPRLGDHWHEAIELSKCGSALPPPMDAREEDPFGIHTHGDGLVHIHPFVAKAAGDRAVLGLFLDQIGAVVTKDALEVEGTSLPFDGDCGGRPAKLWVIRWADAESDTPSSSKAVDGDALRAIPLDHDGGVIAVAFTDDPTAVAKPASAAGVTDPSDSPPSAVAGGDMAAGVPIGKGLILGPVVAEAPPPCQAPGLSTRQGDSCVAVGPEVVGGDAVRSARAQLNGSQWSVSITLTDAGLRSFNDLAAACFDRKPACPVARIAIVVDGVVQSSPSVQTPSFNGPIQISGDFSEREAKDLAAQLSP